MTRRQAIKLLKTNKQIDCLNLNAYLSMLLLSLEVTGKNPDQPVAKLVKAWEPNTQGVR